jgi:hypothetical protein
MFADTLGGLIVDREMIRIVAMVGLIGISTIVSRLDPGDGNQDAFHLWIGGVAMAWVNIIVSLLVPEVQGNTSPFTDIMGAAALLLGMQV